MSLFVCGTSTGVGKTVVSAAIMKQYGVKTGVRYWKPVQTGTPPDDDREDALVMSGIGSEFFLPVEYSFKAALSPHRAAELEDSRLDLEILIQKFRALESGGPLLIEGAGGLLVPLNRTYTWLDFLKKADLPVLLTALSGLGTINHSLLTIQALQTQGIKVAGIVFSGPPNPDNVRTVLEFSKVPLIASYERKTGEPLSGRIDPEQLLQPYLKP